MLLQRLQLSKAKHRSLAGHSNISKFIARLLPHYDFNDDAFFNADQASTNTVLARQRAFEQLSAQLSERAPLSIQHAQQAQTGVSDMQFVGRYRVPFPFAKKAQSALKMPSFLSAVEPHTFVDLDGNRHLDLTGSYGVNVLGHSFYTQVVERAASQVGSMTSALGYYSPDLLHNVNRLKAISGQEEVSFHMSGTEAVMQAVRLARYHTRKTHVVRFCGAYHGWWGDVQPGIGNPSKAFQTYTLADLSERSLKVIRTRKDIACVLVNPLQILHPNQNAPGDSSLVAQRLPRVVSVTAYSQWLKALRAACDAAQIPLIFDEVFVGFRLAIGGAQAYFGVKADMVTYGKTLGGGLPVGVLCGQHRWMRRYDPRHPANVCFARGTFNSHPVVMNAMAQFLAHLDKPETQALYAQQDAFWNGWAVRFNHAFEQCQVPLQVVNLQSIWSVCYTQPSRYHWMYQFYLRKHGVALPWVGTGRLIFSLDYTDVQMLQVLNAMLAAAQDMKQGGWWTCGLPSQKAIAKRLIWETLRALF